MADHQGIYLYPSTTIEHLLIISSNHNPTIIDTDIRNVFKPNTF